MPGHGAPKPKILFASALLSEQTYQSLFRDAPVPPSQAAQKYHRVLIEGIRAAGAETEALSMPPVSRSTSRKLFLPARTENSDGIRYRTLPILNLPVLRHILIFLSAFFAVLFSRQSYDAVLINGLYFTFAGAVRRAARIRRFPCIAIVTDLPDVLSGNSLVGTLNARSLTRYDGYILLTEAMNERINPRRRPHLIVEGQADARMAARENRLEDKFPEKVCLYAGMLHEKYGILRLVRAFRKADAAGSALYIYGTGDAEEQVRDACREDSRIRYFGVVPNETVLEAEIRASLLINPRPSSEEFTRFSFPSKNLEYMASGTPVLTTDLPGMPREYLPYVYLFREESDSGMADMLRNVLSLSAEALHIKGAEAKRFVLTQKSNLVQGKRILNFIERISK